MLWGLFPEDSKNPFWGKQSKDFRPKHGNALYFFIKTKKTTICKYLFSLKYIQKKLYFN